MVQQFENAGLSFVGRDETGQRMEVSFYERMASDVFYEVCITLGVKWLWAFYCHFDQIIELPSHPYFVGAQFHPEFKSRPGKPSALFLGIISTHHNSVHWHFIKCCLALDGMSIIYLTLCWLLLFLMRVCTLVDDASCWKLNFEGCCLDVITGAGLKLDNKFIRNYLI